MFEVRLSAGPTLSPLLERQLREIAGDHHQVDVAPGGTIRANKTWKNIGAAGNRDICAIYGTGTTIEAFVMEFGAVVVDQYCAAGGQVATPVDCLVPAAATMGLRNALVGVGKYDPATSVITLDDYEIVVNAINVTGAPSPPTVPKGEQVSVAFVAV